MCGQDYINPIDLCNRLNAFVLPEHAVHAFLTLLFLLGFQWTCIILNAPLLAFNVNKCVILLPFNYTYSHRYWHTE